MLYALCIFGGAVAGMFATLHIVDNIVDAEIDLTIEAKARAERLHRRAQKAEGRLQRIDRILAEEKKE